MYAKAGLDAKAIVAKALDALGTRQAPELQPADIAFLAERARRRRGLPFSGGKRVNGGAA